MKERDVPVWLWYVLAALLVLADQIVKLWVKTNMTLGEARPFIPHLIELRYTLNTGGAFSLLSHYTWLLTAVSAVLTVFLALLLWKGWLTTNRFSKLCVALVLAGAAGNLIDRAVWGEVTDMFNFTFMTFGIFNVADICVVGGVIGYAAYTIFAQFKEPTVDELIEDSHETDPDSPQ